MWGSHLSPRLSKSQLVNIILTLGSFGFKNATINTGVITAVKITMGTSRTMKWIG